MEVKSNHNSKRVAWLEKAYKALRNKLINEAPEDITILAGFPSKSVKAFNRKNMGECCYNFMKQGGRN